MDEAFAAAAWVSPLDGLPVGCGHPGCAAHLPCKPAGCTCPAFTDHHGHHITMLNLECQAH